MTRTFYFGLWHRLACLFVVGAMLTAGNAAAQQGGGHSPYPVGLPVGAVGQGTLLQPLPMRGYFQPIRFNLPEGTSLALAENGTFVPPQKAPMQVGLLVGHVYRFQITEIPYNSGLELYPTIEIINRLYPPPGKENEFPVEVEITLEDMELALSGRLVTRVIYLEDPLSALPTQGEEHIILSRELEPTQNPLIAAKQYGRPMAILRMGNRQPTPEEIGPDFLFGSPSWQAVPQPQPIIEAQSETRIVR
jgi:hypothetical protein